jgi:23S rRNA (uridine2552-2'-O)-methyltransferase
MSPNISGNYSVDHAISIFLCEQALITASTFLKPGGNFICKVFDGEELPRFISDVKNIFSMVKKFSPPASRKSSSEIFIIAKFFKK